MLRPIARVECGSCVACCKRQLVPLQPDDDASLYETVEHPSAGLVLAQKPNGDCVHLGSDGCEVYPNHPTVCRVFDCAEQFRRSSRADRRRLLKLGVAVKAVFAAGRERAGL